MAMLLSAGATMAQDAAPEQSQGAAPERSKMNVIGGLVLGSNAGIDKSGIGINLGGEYFFTDKIAAAPSITYFLRSKTQVSTWYGTYTSGVRAFAIDLDGRYYFGAKDNFSFYGLAGLAIASVKAFTEDSEGKKLAEATDSKTGINLGAGVVYPLNEKVSLNGQIKYNTPMEQFAIQAGIIIPINL